MKRVSLSFDDARLDTWTVAKPIMDRYGIKATVNVVSDYVNNPDQYSFENSPQSMTAEQVLAWENWGGEVACHGSTHNNTAEDILANISELKAMGVDTSSLGFASPSSMITENNLDEYGIKGLEKNKTISYIRSGIVVRRESFLYIIGSVVEMITHSSWLFYMLNKKSIITRKKPHILPSVAIKNYTTVKQVKNFINMMEDGDAVILMLHSVLPQNDVKNKKDHWFWEKDNFVQLCDFLGNRKDVEIVLTKSLLE